MKATELQLEDLVMYNRCVWRVYGLSMPYPRKEDRYNNKAVITLWGNGLIDTLEEEIDPIPLTAEILEKNGFHYFPSATPYYYHERMDIALNKKQGCSGYYTDALNHRCNISFVHELQHALRLCRLNDLADSIII